MKLRPAFETTMALLSHFATVTAVCGGIWGFLFPDDLAKFIAKLDEKIGFYSEEIEKISVSSNQTADATQEIAKHLSQRPAFEATLNMTSSSATYSSNSQFVVRLHNNTPYTARDLTLIFWGQDGGITSSFDPAVIPPFESHLDMDSREISRVCYSYIVDDGTPERVTEDRRLARTTQPVRDALGNEATYPVFQTSYDYHVEEDTSVITCSEFHATLPLEKPQ